MEEDEPELGAAGADIEEEADAVPPQPQPPQPQPPPPRVLSDAIWDHRPLEEIREIIEKSLSSSPCSLRDLLLRPAGRLGKFGYVPLHDALDAGAPLDVVRHLAELCPESLQVMAAGLLPLHRAILLAGFDGSNRNNDGGAPVLFGLELIRFLVEQWPLALQTRTTVGWLPLLLALDSQRSWDMPLEPDVVRYLVEQWPGALGQAGYRGATPLHCLLQCRTVVTLDAVKMLVEPFPDALLMTDTYYGRTPLHLALHRFDYHRFDHHLSLETIQYMVAKAPRSLRRTTLSGELPLHAALASGAPLAHIRFLAEQWPGALRAAAGEDGDLPLRRAVLLGRVDCVPVLVEMWAGAIRVRSHVGTLPVHDATASRAPNLEMVRALVEPWPESVLERDATTGATPLHCVVSRSDDQAAIGLARYLVERSHPSTALLLVADNRGWLPLHAAAAGWHSTSSTAMVRLLALSEPEALLVGDNFGQRPLDVAISTHQPAIVEVLADLRPETLEERGGRGRLPLHSGVADGPDASPGVVFVLVRVHPGALMAPDDDGNLPVHLALSTHAPAEVVRILVEERPDALQVKNGEGLIPLHVALAQLERAAPASAPGNSAPPPALETVPLLVERRPESLQARDSAGRVALHVLAAHSGAAVVPEDAIEVADLLVERWPGALRARDARGFLPFHAAATSGAPPSVLYHLVRLGPDLLRGSTGGVRPAGPFRFDDPPASSKRARTGQQQSVESSAGDRS